MAGHKIPVVAGVLPGTGGAILLYLRVPQGFIPEDDQATSSSSCRPRRALRSSTRSNICAKVEESVSHVPEVTGAFTVAGFSFSGSASNRAMILPEPGRTSRNAKAPNIPAPAIVGALRGPLMGIPGALVVPFNPPAVQGLGQFGGFQFELEDQGRNTLQQLANTANQLVRRGKSER